MPKECKCEDWTKNIDTINSLCTLSMVHGGLGYSGKTFKHCPWCGRKLKEPKPEKV